MNGESVNRRLWVGPVVGLLALVLVASAAAFIPSAYASEPSNENPPAFVETEGSVLLDDQALGGFIKTKVGDNLALGQGGGVGLQHDPDGPGGFPNTEDSNEGFFEERWCLEYDGPGGNVNQCNAVFTTGIPSGPVADTSSPGQLQATGSAALTAVGGSVSVSQVVTLRSLSSALVFQVTLTNVGGSTLTNVEYLRNHDPDIGIRLGVGFTTDNQAINRPLPGAAPPMIVAATVRPSGETRTVGLGTPVLPPAGGVSDVSIRLFGLVHTDPDQVISGVGVTRGPLVRDVGNAIAWRIPSLAPDNSVTLDFCYGFAQRPGSADRATVANDIVDVFNDDCRGVVEVPVDVKPQSCRNPLNANSKGLLAAAILGTASLDVTQVDVTTIQLEGVSPSRSSLEDVATPFVPFTGKTEANDCTDEGPDGFLDLNLKFDNQAIVAALGAVTDGDVRVLQLTGNLLDGTAIVGEDVVVIVKKK